MVDQPGNGVFGNQGMLGLSTTSGGHLGGVEQASDSLTLDDERPFLPMAADSQDHLLGESEVVPGPLLMAENGLGGLLPQTPGLNSNSTLARARLEVMQAARGRMNMGQQTAAARQNAPAGGVSPARNDGSKPYEAIIRRAAQEYDLDENLIRSVMKVESGFNPKAVSPAGAQGLMQLMPATAKELGVTKPFDPEQNIMAGSRYLKGLMERYRGNVNLTLAAYNWGMGNLERNPKAMPAETRQYVAKVKSAMVAAA
ncbi:MAG: lytic transglycosylase domain-containing protein [Magnetococcales bacterium]|nr:lytic transglycosylase domain-containing protein [Magnetococcales bacterium]